MSNLKLSSCANEVKLMTRIILRFLLRNTKRDVACIEKFCVMTRSVTHGVQKIEQAL
jgi:hypothetical protein